MADNSEMRVPFVAGKFSGYKGRLDASRQRKRYKDGSVYYPVIVELPNQGDVITHVLKASMVLDNKATTHAERVIQQCPDLERSLVSLCRKFAQCDIARDRDGFAEVVRKYTNDAIEWQVAKGVKAVYRSINDDEIGDGKKRRKGGNNKK